MIDVFLFININNKSIFRAKLKELTTWVHAGSSIFVTIPPLCIRISVICFSSSSGNPIKHTLAP